MTAQTATWSPYLVVSLLEVQDLKRNAVASRASTEGKMTASRVTHAFRARAGGYQAERRRRWGKVPLGHSASSQQDAVHIDIVINQVIDRKRPLSAHLAKQPSRAVGRASDAR